MPSFAPINDTSENCVDQIRERCGVAINELQATMSGDEVRITGQVGSWHGKQLASEAARQLFPGMRIDNKLIVTTAR